MNIRLFKRPKIIRSLKLIMKKQSRLIKNYFYVPVKIYDSKNLPSGAVLTIRVKLYKNVLVASNEIRRNENLSANLFDVKIGGCLAV